MNKFSLFVLLITTFTVTSQNSVTICWDSSLSMKDRNIESEINFLDHYFSTNKNIEATLVVFSNTIQKTEKHTITDSHWDKIKNKLLNTICDGATSYKQLPVQVSAGDILLFTDGFQNYDGSIIKFNNNLTVINANSNFNDKSLQQIVQQNNGEFINLLSSDNQYNSINKGKMYTGKVYSHRDIVPDILISIKDSDRKTVVNKDGTYQIEANPGDVLVFSYLGKKIIEQELDESINNDVWLNFKGEELDNVIVKGKNIKKEESTLIQTSSGLQKKEKVGYAVQSVKNEDFISTAVSISDAIDGQITGLQKGINDDISQSVIRGMLTMYGNNYPIIFIDGAPIARSNSATGGRVEITDFISLDNIADVSVLKGLAATNKYGSLGANGVILITTKSYYESQVNDENKNTALIKDNIYKEIIKKKDITFTTPYLKEINKETTVAKAYDKYLEQRVKYWDDPYYFIDIFNFFKGSNDDIAYRILSNIIEQGSSSIIALRGTLFTATLNNNHQLALKLSDIVLEKYPNNTQSYMDVAMANKNAGNYQTAATMFLRIINGSINSKLNFSGLKNTAENEIRNLVLFHKNDLNLKRIPLNYQKEYSLDVRMLINWNNPEAEFELQFVNPDKRFFTWEHTKKNADRIEDELKNGYSQEQVEIDGGAKGEWIVNVKYLGNRTLSNKTPTFLKYTIQYNFGKPDQINKEYMIRLYNKGQKELITKLYTR